VKDEVSYSHNLQIN